MLSARDTEDGYECHISGKRVFILRTTGSHLVDSLLGCVPRNEDTPIADHAEATLEHRIGIVDVLRMMITTPLVNTPQYSARPNSLVWANYLGEPGDSRTYALRRVQNRIQLDLTSDIVCLVQQDDLETPSRAPFPNTLGSPNVVSTSKRHLLSLLKRNNGAPRFILDDFQ